MKSTYTAIEVHQFGAPGVMKAVQKPFRPLKHGEALVRVSVAGVSNADVMMRQGVYLQGPKPPFVPGYDMVGVVEEVDPAVKHIQVGDRVAALTIIGSFAEYVYVDAGELHRVPEQADAAEVVALVLNYVTAYQMLLHAAAAKRGETVLVYGAGGGVGTALLELGKIHGIHMVGTASPGKHDLITSYGAKAIDHSQPMDGLQRDLRAAAPGGYDVILEATGGPQFRRSLGLLKKGGRLVLYGVTHRVNSKGVRSIWKDIHMYANIVPVMALSRLYGKQALIYSITSWKKKDPQRFANDLQALFSLLTEKHIQPVIAGRLPLTEAQQAHERLERRGVKGKLVLLPGQEGR
ncbi:zinc-binding dehydrogenase [Paenibacillus hexagrammi]|uniref:Zinc-binding dehydrogenase n=1 Tax=Paenibacillus hexagrammi TaxID=2908839 RepID=A0ABY3SHS5_9BACL|nr:zinc-binding dehydrogenase [Paenibacillus sp. YPD9-1]UJF33506.1 zinc-binding dehydrogenase [Paenibacillus sp. YPD9-1]